MTSTLPPPCIVDDEIIQALRRLDQKPFLTVDIACVTFASNGGRCLVKAKFI
jgi:hypothetical protein